MRSQRSVIGDCRSQHEAHVYSQFWSQTYDVPSEAAIGCAELRAALRVQIGVAAGDGAQQEGRNAVAGSGVGGLRVAAREISIEGKVAVSPAGGEAVGPGLCDGAAHLQQVTADGFEVRTVSRYTLVGPEDAVGAIVRRWPWSGNRRRPTAGSEWPARSRGRVFPAERGAVQNVGLLLRAVVDVALPGQANVGHGGGVHGPERHPGWSHS